MQMTRDELQDVVDTLGEVMKARKKEIDLAASADDAVNGHASPDLIEAQTETSASIDKFKAKVAQKIKDGGYTIVQENDPLPEDGDYVVMPADIQCDCG